MLLADELRRRSARSAQDLEELFRRMVFNALISNTDDHPRNHALIATTDKWGLSPAYDLTPNPLTSLEKRGDPRVRHALAGVLLLRADVTTNDARQREPMLRRIQLLPALTLALAG